MPGGPYVAVDHVSVVLPALSGLTRDNVVNTFTFQSGADLDPSHYGDIDICLQDFYGTTATGATAPLGTYIGASISRTAPVITKHYRVEGHLNGTAAGSPASIGNIGTLPTPTGGVDAAFPSEVACALGFHGPYGSTPEFGGGAPATRPRSRLRGRIYLGPLIANSFMYNVESGTKRIVVGTQLYTDMLAAGRKLFNDLAAIAPPVNWVVWSRKNADIAVITTLTVDDAFDTQRRRGADPVVRHTQALP